MKRHHIETIALLFVVPLLVTLSLPARAAEQTGKINGTVYDPDGVPLAGVTVTITSPNMMGKRKIQTSDEGSFLFFGLPPGKYDIEIDQSGFLPYKQSEVRVSIGGTASLDILLEVPTAEETITVTARRPVVDIEKTQLGENYDDEFLEEIPIGRSYQSVAQLAPGVVGGSNPNIHGGTALSNQYLVDGVNTTDPATNTFASNFNFDAIKEVQIITGGLDAEYGQATGGIINLVTKSGGNEFHVDTSLYVIPDWLMLRDDFEREAVGDENYYYFNVNLGGPILKDKLWYFGSVELRRNISYISPTEDFFDPTNPDMLQHAPWRWFSVYYLGKLTFQATDKHKVTAIVQGDPAWIENAVQSSTFASEAEEKRFQFGGFYTMAWEALWTKSLFQKTQVGLMYSGMRQEPMTGCKDLYDENCRCHIDNDTGLYTNNYYRDSLDHRYRLQIDSAWTYYLDNLFGDHEWKVGFNYARTWTDFRNQYPGGGYYHDRGGRPWLLTMFTPDAEGNISPYETTHTGNTLGIFIQDAWKITKTLTFKPGVRIDWVQMMDWKGRPVIEYAGTSPRMNVVWDATGDGKTVVRAGYNRYVDPGWFNLSSFLGKNALQERWEYNPTTGQYDILYRRYGEEQLEIKGDNLTAPHTDEFNIQAERELFTDFAMGINFVYREFKFLFEDVEVNQIWNQPGTYIIGYKNGGDTGRWQMQNPRQAWRRYFAFEITARKAFSDNWQMNASYTYSRSEGAPEEFFAAAGYMDNPRMDPYYWSWSTFDRRHVLKIDGSYHLPWGVEIGASFWWATGYPFSKYFLDEYGEYGVLRDKKGYDPDHPDNPYWNRLPDRMQVDLKVVWDLKELTGQQIDLIGRMINVMHLRYKVDLETAVYPEGSPREYGQYYGMSDGFRAEVGVRYRY